MIWFAIIAAVAKGVGNFEQAKLQHKTQKAAADAAFAQLGREFDAVNLESAQEARKTSAALFNLDIQGDNMSSQVQLQSAATDTIGASVQDALSTIEVVTGRQEANAIQQYQYGEEERYRQITGSIEATAASVDQSYDALIKTTQNMALNPLGEMAQIGAAQYSQGAGAKAADSAMQGSTNSELFNKYGNYVKMGSSAGAASSMQGSGAMGAGGSGSYL